MEEGHGQEEEAGKKLVMKSKPRGGRGKGVGRRDYLVLKTPHVVYKCNSSRT